MGPDPQHWLNDIHQGYVCILQMYNVGEVLKNARRDFNVVFF